MYNLYFFFLLETGNEHSDCMFTICNFFFLLEDGGPPRDGLLELLKFLALPDSGGGQQRPDLSECYEKLEDPQGMACCSSMLYIRFLHLQVA
jgi:hypothetical protein